MRAPATAAAEAPSWTPPGPGRSFVNQRQVNTWTGALLVKNIQSHYPPLLSRHTAISTPPTCSYIVRRASAAHLLISLIPEPALLNLSEEEQMNSPKTGSQKVYTLSSASQSPPPPERGAPLQGQPRPKGSSVDNQALHPLDLLGRDHGVEPREKLLALRLIIERARVLVLCAVR